MKKNIDGILCAFPYLLFSFLILASQEHPFFWDTTQLASEHAHYIYATGQLLLPDDIDSGHPPTLGLLLATCWKVLGQYLWVGHWLMWPFLMGLTWFIQKISFKYLQNHTQANLTAILVLADATLLGQASLCSPDIPLLFFFFWAFYESQYGRRAKKSAAWLGLSAMGMRGMFCVVALAMQEIASETLWSKNIKSRVSRLIIDGLPAALFTVCFLTWHYQQKGWIGYHTASPWADSFNHVDFQGFIRNVIVLGWRVVDFGRLGIWVVIGFILTVSLYANKSIVKAITSLPDSGIARYALITGCVLGIPLLMYTGLLGHRYLLPFYLLVGLWASIVSFKTYIAKWAFPVMLVTLLSGHFWVYPDNIAKGWDSSLAHWPYFELKKQALSFIEQESISVDSVGAVFPCDKPFDVTDLGQDTRKFASKNLEKNEYVLYGNVFNDFTDAEASALSTWTVQKEWKNGQVWLILLKRPNKQ